MKPVEYLDNLPNVKNAEPENDENQCEQNEGVDKGLHRSPGGFEELDTLQHKEWKGDQGNDDG